MSVTVGYGVEIVGSNLDEVMENDPEKFIRYLNALLKAMAKETYEHVSANLAAIPFKKPTGTLQHALRWDSGDGWAAVYMDDRIAPYAPHVETGVHPHTMRYLLKATSAIPVQVGSATLFRWATEKWMGRPHTIVDPVSGLVHMSKGWQHPGYEGRYFMRDGVRDAVKVIDERTENFVFRIFTMGESAAGDSL